MLITYFLSKTFGRFVSKWWGEVVYGKCQACGLRAAPTTPHPWMLMWGSLPRDQSAWTAMHGSLAQGTVPRAWKLSDSLGSGVVRGDGKVNH